MLDRSSDYFHGYFFGVQYDTNGQYIGNRIYIDNKKDRSPKYFNNFDDFHEWLDNGCGRTKIVDGIDHTQLYVIDFVHSGGELILSYPVDNVICDIRIAIKSDSDVDKANEYLRSRLTFIKSLWSDFENNGVNE